MRVRTITCHHVYNHGALLQAYALVTYLRIQGHDAKIIDYRPEYLNNHFKLRVANPRYDKPVVRWAYLLVKFPGWLKSLKRKKAFDEFYDRFMDELTEHPTYFSYEVLRDSAPQADVYIAGSDQIWNTTFKNGRDKAFYLDFGRPEVKRISYAASFATCSIDKNYHDFVQSELGCFGAISVREQSGVELAEQFGCSAVKVMDPVFLLDERYWRVAFECEKLEPETYILVYDFEKSNVIKELAQRLAAMHKCKIYVIGSSSLSYADKNFVNYGPDMFLRLVANSRVVVSNSFHATAFALIFRKDFFVAKRVDGLNNRMEEILTEFNLTERLVDAKVTDGPLYAPINYEIVSPMVAQKTAESKTWLNNQLR